MTSDASSDPSITVRPTPLTSFQRAHRPTPSRPVRVVPRDLERQERIAAHCHAWPQITFALQGAFRVSTPHMSWIVPPSRAIWIPEMMQHEVVMLDRVVLRSVYVHQDLLGGQWKQCQVVQVSSLLREVIAALSADDLAQQRKREAALSALVIDELERSVSLPLGIRLPQDKRLRNLCEQLLSDPSVDLTLAQWARRVAASPRTLERLFRDQLGVSFGQWRRSVRLAHGVALISRGHSIAQTAEALGYASQSAFTAMFRRAFGQAPRAFFGEPTAGDPA
jgi:AraC-like DNA-binding protein